MQRRKKSFYHAAKITSLFALLMAVIQFSPINDYIQSVKGTSAPEHAAYTFASSQGDDQSELHAKLLEQIREQAKLSYEAPINAKVDPVWQAIPGYNGIEVDIKRTYEWNKKHPAETITYLYREVEPDIGLDDLGAYPIYKGNPNKKMVAIMINVAWGDEYLPAILTTLQDEDVKATFFFDGSWLSDHLEIARSICEAGHECSNHAYSHKNMSELSRHEARKEIVRTEQLLKQELGVRNRWFAPPSGDYDQETVAIADELGLKTVLWTIDTVDWKNPQPQWIVRRIGAALEPGSLILMHPTSSSSQALAQMISLIKQEGYRLGTVSEVLSSERLTMIEEPFDF